jgi:hypothetical protein
MYLKFELSDIPSSQLIFRNSHTLTYIRLKTNSIMIANSTDVAIVCLYAMLSGLIKLLLTPGGGAMAGICANAACNSGLGFFNSLVTVGRKPCQLDWLRLNNGLAILKEQELRRMKKQRSSRISFRCFVRAELRSTEQSHDPFWRSTLEFKMHLRPCGANTLSQ